MPVPRQPAAHSSSGARRRRVLLPLLALLLIATLPLGTRAQESGERRIYWGTYLPSVPWDMAPLDAFETAVDKRVSIIHWGQPWILAGDWQPFYPNDFQKVRDRGSIPMLDWGSWDYTLGPFQEDFQLADVARGDHDAHIRAWAAGAAAWGHPFFLRFNWEMNGYWLYPWSEQLNGNQPGDYVRAWRHVHDIFRDAGATNATWVWCPNAVLPDTTPLESLYPGDDYVDWVCMDGYNWGTDRESFWKSFNEVFGPTYKELRLLAPSKPILIGETASSEDGGSKAAWITDALSVQLPRYFPWVQGILWFNWNAGDPELDWPVASSPASIAAARAALASDFFAANAFAELDESPIPPLTDSGSRTLERACAHVTNCGPLLRAVRLILIATRLE